MKTILIYYEDDCTRAPRVHKQLNALLSSFNVLLVTKKFDSKQKYNSNLNVILLPSTADFFTSSVKPTRLKSLTDRVNRFLSGDFFKHPLERDLWNNQHRNKLKLILRHDFDCIINHHPSSLVLTKELSRLKKVPFIFNAHEYYPRQFEHKVEWVINDKPSVDFILQKYLPQAETTFCVANIIGQTYIDEFKIKNFVFVPNDKPYFETIPNKTKYPIRIIHHGGCIRGRSLHKSIELMKFLPKDKYELYLMLMPVDKVYLAEMKELARKHENIHFIPPVNFEEIIPLLSNFDIGFFLLPPVNYNSLNCLPNKIYEFIQARLCLVTSPNPEMSTLIKQNGLGICSEDYTVQSMAVTIQSISPLQIDEFKQQVDSKAKELSSETTENLIRETVSSIV